MPSSDALDLILTTVYSVMPTHTIVKRAMSSNADLSVIVFLTGTALTASNTSDLAIACVTSPLTHVVADQDPRTVPCVLKTHTVIRTEHAPV